MFVIVTFFLYSCQIKIFLDITSTEVHGVAQIDHTTAVIFLGGGNLSWEEAIG